MYGKMQEFGLTEIIPFICISVIWGQYPPAFLKSLPDFPDNSNSKESACNAGGTGDLSLIPGLGRSLGVGNVNALEYSSLKSSMDRGAWWPIIYRVAIVTQTQLSG